MSIEEEIEVGRGKSSKADGNKLPFSSLHAGMSKGHYRLKHKHGSRGNGKLAKAHADYILKEGRYSEGERAAELVYAESGNMPEWAEERPTDFWEASDLYSAKNARLYTEFELSLPRQLNPEQRLELVKGFMAEHIGDRHPYSLAMHNSRAMDGGENPHAHLMFTERQLDGIQRSPAQFFKRANKKHPERGGTPVDRDWNRRDKVQELREDWADRANHALEKAGLDVRVDHRSLKEQGIDRMPEPKLAPSTTAMLKKGKASRFVSAVLELREINKAIQEEKQKIAAEVGRVAPPIEKAGNTEKPEAERPTPLPEKAAEATKPETGQPAPPLADLVDRAQQLVQEGEKLTEQAKTGPQGIRQAMKDVHRNADLSTKQRNEALLALRKQRRELERQQPERIAQFKKRVEAVKREVGEMPKGEARTALLDSLKASSRISKKLDKGKGFSR